MSSVKTEVTKPSDPVTSSAFSKKVEESKDVSKRQEKKSTKAAKDFKEPKERRNNVIIVRQNIRFKTLVILAKNMLKSQFDSIELHGVDDQSYLTVSLVTQCLMKYKYVTMERLKTKTVQAMDGPKTFGKEASHDADLRVVLQPRLVVHLKKTPEFDSIFDEFE